MGNRDVYSPHRNGNATRSDRRIPRRRFIAAVGAGSTTGLAGCTNIQTIWGHSSRENATTVTWSALNEFSEYMPEIREMLWNAGLPKDIHLQHVPHPGETTDEIRAQFQMWLNAGRSNPDMFLADTAWTIPFVIGDQVVNLSDQLPQETLGVIEDKYVQQLLPTVRSANTGDFYGVPMTIDVAGIQYRKDLVEAAGYDPEGEKWATEGITWKRFSNVVADTLERNPEIDYGYTFQGRAYEGLSCCNFNEWMTSFGGAYFGGRKFLFGPVGDRPITVDEQPLFDAISMIRTFMYGNDDQYALDGYAGEISPIANLQWAETTSATPFTTGNAITNRNWPTSWIDSAEKFGNDLGVMVIPAGVSEDDAKYDGTGGTRRSFIGGWANMVNPYSKSVTPAAKVIQYMTDNEELRRLLFEKLALIPPNLEIMDGKGFRQSGIIGQYVDTLQTTAQRAIPRAATVAWDPESTEIAQQVHRALARQNHPEEAMGNLKSTIEVIENELQRE